MERLTLDEAICRVRGAAKKQRWNSKYTKVSLMNEELNKRHKADCIKDAEEHEQLAEWLEELKSYKDIGTPKELKELKENGAFTGLELAKLAIMQKELKKYKDLEKQGLLVRLPCKVGDDIYVIPSQPVYGINIINGFEKFNRVYHQHIGSITFFDNRWYATSREEYGIHNEKVLNDIAYGITWFTDHEKAEKKLEEMKKNGI